MDDRRQFTRIVYSTPAQLHLANSAWDVELLDLSLKGALVRKTSDFDLDINHTYHLDFNLAGSDLTIVMSVMITHQENDHIGLSCQHIDIDSVTHLKRMIELNVGNDALLNRDLDNLSHQKD